VHNPAKVLRSSPCRTALRECELAMTLILKFYDERDVCRVS
jgi:hypothetical protein